ncbi:hypothetical protein KUTeg_014472 [Tegillarca granosa]|uniref:Mitochondrial 2-oxodicarboxylate carrier n=1 Tax=Tegillarca granosa TaxID=220873 RepID=A0ABQ9F226_TEGGR|nr:hypothetical protein KUTeg_014472 [Tegillarca granosa]
MCKMTSIENVSKTRNPVILSFMQLAAGGCAGFVEVSIMHPLDLVKTRFQIQRGPDDPNRYTSLADCFKKMYRQEGFLSFYKGILPPLLAETPKRAVKFFTFEKYKHVYGYGSYLPPELQKSTIATAREIVKQDGFGLKGLNKGLTATLGRHGVFNMFYFSFYHNVREMIPQVEDPMLEVGRKLLIGLIAGTLASCINIPFDVAKSRIQGPQPVPGEIKYKKCFATIVTVYKEEGFFALYKGLIPKILRLGPGGAIMFLVYEHTLEWMKNTF